jgi:PKD repeat protein
VPAGSVVTFSSKLEHTDAVKVEWDFGDGTKETVTKLVYPSTSVTHKYETGGTEDTVTEKIYVDDLAAPAQVVYKEGHLTTPTITETRTIKITPAAPTARLTAPAEAKTGETVTFSARVSDHNKGGFPLKLRWNFGDGSPEVETEAASESSAMTHAFAAAGRYTVKLTAIDKLGLEAHATPLEIAVTAPPPEEKHEEKHDEKHEEKHEVLSYSVSLAATSLPVTPAGAFSLKVDCSGQSSCVGTATVRSASAVSASGKHKSILTLASGSFNIAGGQVKAVSLHLSSKAKSVLKRLHALRAKVKIVARDAQGVTHTTEFVITLRLSKHH